uniref:Ig-like domain-containing protein n=1 Tax=Eptatretus burgeri TaxID=7764 RepID=A0A8C4QS81_EPTBU
MATPRVGANELGGSATAVRPAREAALLFAAMNNSYLTSESHNQVMVAKEGDNVTLQCLLQAHCQIVNVSITWTLFGVNGEFRQVFAFENGEKMYPLFDSRVVWLGGSDVRRPAISLSRLEIGDGGSYTCRAQCDNNTSVHSIKLNVTKIEIPKVKKLYANYNVSGTEVVSSSVKESAHAGVLVTAVLLSSALFFILVSMLLGLALKRLKQRRQRLEEERRRRFREASRKRYFSVQKHV